jgi:hypothetical protein
MGRELKRVPLDFDWPLDTIWAGYDYNLPGGLSEELSDKWGGYLYEHRIHPPAGDGYQIWETVTEGSPISPVFATPDELAAWMVEHDTSITKNTTKEQWVKFITGPGWSPSMVFSTDKGMQSGVEFVADQESGQ